MTPEDAVPQDMRPQDPVIRPIDVSHSVPRIVRLTTHICTGLSVVGALGAAFTSWGGGFWEALWIFTATVGAVGLIGGIVRIFLHDGDDGYIMQLIAMVAAGAAAATVGLCVSRLVHDLAYDSRATLSVSATVTDCQSDADQDVTCTYHWTYDGVVHTQAAGAPQLWQDGHHAAVRINPSRPDDLAVISPQYVFFYVVIVIAGLAIPLLLGLVAFAEMFED